jgi:transcriptional regulator with XRE-family HTH domain
MDEKLAILKSKKIGLFIRQARQNGHRSAEECAAWLNLNTNDYQAIEDGTASPSLPQMESLAHFFNVPFEFILRGPDQIFSVEKSFSNDVNDQLITLRNRVIAAMIKQQRIEKGLSIGQLAETSSLSVERLSSIESGLIPCSIADLENLIEALGLSLDGFFASSGPFAHAEQIPASPKTLSIDLPEDIQEFISKPVNKPYVELAMHLSQMEANKLRSIAASLLEITY